MENNLFEYSGILNELRNIQGEIQALNSALVGKREEDPSADEDSGSEEYKAPTGDILSRLLRRKSVREIR
jgi:hypothetical protein